MSRGDLKPVFQSEVMLAGWKETHNGGATVTFWLPDTEDLEVFRGMTVRKSNTAGQRLACVLVEIPDNEIPLASEDAAREAEGVGAASAVALQSRTPGHPNELARLLHSHGYFRNPKVWQAVEDAGVYTQDDHKHWIESQPCAFAPGGARWGPCEGEIVAHHCKGAAVPASGRGEHPQKPPHWFCVPLCAIGHHQNWAHASHGANRADKQALVEKAIELTAERMKWAMKQTLGLESLADLTAEKWRFWSDLIRFEWRAGDAVVEGME